MVRLAIFNILGEKIKDAKIADLFAGSGSLGLEALSKGASWCDFVDIHPQAVQNINKTLKELRLEHKARVWKKTAIQFLDERPANHYDLILLDPPYSLTSVVHLLNLCGETIKESGVVVFEHSDKYSPQKEYDTLVAVNEKRYGGTAVTFFMKKPLATGH